MAAVVILLALLVVLAISIGGNLGRIAAALNAQNRHYGIGDEEEIGDEERT